MERRAVGVAPEPREQRLSSGRRLGLFGLTVLVVSVLSLSCWVLKCGATERRRSWGKQVTELSRSFSRLRPGEAEKKVKWVVVTPYRKEEMKYVPGDTTFHNGNWTTVYLWCDGRPGAPLPEDCLEEIKNATQGAPDEEVKLVFQVRHTELDAVSELSIKPGMIFLTCMKLTKMDNKDKDKCHGGPSVLFDPLHYVRRLYPPSVTHHGVEIVESEEHRYDYGNVEIPVEAGMQLLNCTTRRPIRANSEGPLTLWNGRTGLYVVPAFAKKFPIDEKEELLLQESGQIVKVSCVEIVSASESGRVSPTGASPSEPKFGFRTGGVRQGKVVTEIKLHLVAPYTRYSQWVSKERTVVLSPHRAVGKPSMLRLPEEFRGLEPEGRLVGVGQMLVLRHCSVDSDESDRQRCVNVIPSDTTSKNTELIIMSSNLATLDTFSREYGKLLDSTAAGTMPEPKFLFTSTGSDTSIPGYRNDMEQKQDNPWSVAAWNSYRKLNAGLAQYGQDVCYYFSVSYHPGYWELRINGKRPEWSYPEDTIDIHITWSLLGYHVGFDKEQEDHSHFYSFIRVPREEAMRSMTFQKVKETSQNKKLRRMASQGRSSFLRNKGNEIYVNCNTKQIPHDPTKVAITMKSVDMRGSLQRLSEWSGPRSS